MGRPTVSRAPGSAIVSGHIQCMVLPARLPPQYLLLPKRVRSPTSSRANPNRPHKYNPRTYTYTHTTRTRQTLADENLTLRRPEIVPELLQVTDQVLGAGGAGRVLKGEYSGFEVAVKELYATMMDADGESLFFVLTSIKINTLLTSVSSIQCSEICTFTRV